MTMLFNVEVLNFSERGRRPRTQTAYTESQLIHPNDFRVKHL